ncbi:hypothetical protein GCM10010191_00960 [Actinomadura vinacea]|uniref:DUF4190 domain-containing protein n=1 Tax=Actinomadura vinacea TaxID=115336 RepID=A0ABP5VEB1_9ACTN
MSTPGQRPYPPQPPPAPPGPRGRKAAVAALVLGLVSVPTLLFCGLGVPLALAGLVLGIVALVRARPGARRRAYEGGPPQPGTGPWDGVGRGPGRGMAIAGIVLSLITLATAGWLVIKVAGCGNPSRYPDEPSRRRCVEQEFPFAKPSAPAR